ncbi:LysR family transcriptional regulator [Babesia caballi]|uniref:LysR family transcriptional regulator n=1 Tax=Babesia caballi TaxID=5871 RepID=A0AAV4LYT6_BABCB|nr:LysR family transcriptional regulator [Babesia caballi]
MAHHALERDSQKCPVGVPCYRNAAVGQHARIVRIFPPVAEAPQRRGAFGENEGGQRPPTAHRFVPRDEAVGQPPLTQMLPRGGFQLPTVFTALAEGALQGVPALSQKQGAIKGTSLGGHLEVPMGVHPPLVELLANHRVHPESGYFSRGVALAAGSGDSLQQRPHVPPSVRPGGCGQDLLQAESHEHHADRAVRQQAQIRHERVAALPEVGEAPLTAGPREAEPTGEALHAQRHAEEPCEAGLHLRQLGAPGPFLCGTVSPRPEKRDATGFDEHGEDQAPQGQPRARQVEGRASGGQERLIRVAYSQQLDESQPL